MWRIALALLPLSCSGWTTAHRVVGSLTAGAIAADCAVTQINLNDGWTEANPFLGRRPGAVALWSSCAIATVSVLAVADALPKARVPLLVGVTLLELGHVGHNLSLWRFNFWDLFR